MDSWLFFLIFGFGGNSVMLDGVMITAARDLIYVTLFLALFFALQGKMPEKKAFLTILVSIPLSIVLIKIIHLFIFEPRPFVSFQIDPLIIHKPDASFPSRHATIMADIASSYFFANSKYLPFFLVLLLAVGISRVYVGVHYPLDIIGGVLVGILSTLISILFLRKIFT